jgi:flagellar biogenesis protein FliO
MIEARRAKVTRTVFIALTAWALLLNAPAHAAPTGTDRTSPALANSQSQTTEAEQSRLARLAQRLSQTDPDTHKNTTSNGTSAPNPTGSVSTPLLTSTPLLRPGSTVDKTGDTSEPSGSPGSTSWFLKTLTSLGIVVGLALLVRWSYVRLGGKTATASSPVVEVLSRTSVAPRSHVMLLRVGGRVLVVSESSAGMRTLASLEDAQEVADILGAVSATRPNSITRGFGQLLNRFTDDHDQQPNDLETAGTDHLTTPSTRDSVSGLLSRIRSMGRQGGSS